MSLSRRRLLQASLGAAQVALLARAGAPKVARAQAMTDGPKQLLTLFMGGGWQSPWSFVPYTDAQVPIALTPPYVSSEPIFFSASQLANLDGSSGSASGPTPPLRVAKLWNEAALKAGMPDPCTGGATSPNGWSWAANQLWNNAMVVHGIDQTTVAHAGGQIAALCGVASSDFKSPSVQAWVADGLFSRFPDRPIPNVWIGGPMPASLSLRSQAHPARIGQTSDIQFLYSDHLAGAWQNLKASDISSTLAPVNFDGSPGPTGFVLNPIEDRVLRRLRAQRGVFTASSQSVLEQLYDGLLGVSQVLAKDVTSIVSNTQGVQYTSMPFWAPAGATSHFAVNAPFYRSDPGTTWDPQLQLALRMLKSNVCSSVAVGLQAPAAQSWDNGHSLGHAVQFVQVRAMFEVLGRLLGEMKATPGTTAGKSLLDETLVVVLSDFARTFPGGGAHTSSDHWASHSVIFAGGGINTNRMLGSYDVQDPKAIGYYGAPLTIQEAAGPVTRVPRASDIVTTALAIMGINQIRIPGGNGEILGVRAGT
jgi:hypothetical protein